MGVLPSFTGGAAASLSPSHTTCESRLLYIRALAAMKRSGEDSVLAYPTLPVYNIQRPRSQSSASAPSTCPESPDDFRAGPSHCKFSVALLLRGSCRRQRSCLLVSLMAACVLLLSVHRLHGCRYSLMGIVGSRKVCRQEAGVEAHPPGLAAVPRILAPAAQEHRPLTNLGSEADKAYENVGSINPDEYRGDLEDFLRTRFPVEDGREDDPRSLMSILHTILPASAASQVETQNVLRGLLLEGWKYSEQLFKHLLPKLWTASDEHTVIPTWPTVPKQIFQTGPYAGQEPPPGPAESWMRLNPNYSYRYFDDASAAGYIESRFNESHIDRGQEKGVVDAYRSLQSVPVMQADFWRYAILATQGGVYSKHQR